MQSYDFSQPNHRGSISEMGQFEKLQPGLFDRAGSNVELTPALRVQLATLVEALLSEIAAALTIREGCDDQDHR
jgi:hypothetical protein